MGIKDILGKLMRNPSRNKTPGIKLSPAEVELASYKERERQDNIKKELAKYRKQAANEFIMGHKIEAGSSLMSSKSTLLKKQKKTKNPKILGVKNTFFR